MSRDIFITYHPDDEDRAMLIHDLLSHRDQRRVTFPDPVFLKGGLPALTPLAEQELWSSDVVLVVVGPAWSKAHQWRHSWRHKKGVASAGIRAALKCWNVIVVLIDVNKIPSAENLPKDIRSSLQHRRRVHLRSEHLEEDSVALVEAVSNFGAIPWPSGPPLSLPGAAAVVTGAALAISAVSMLGLFRKKRLAPDEVYLGVSIPATVSRGETFVGRFAAYTDTSRDKVTEVIEQEAPTSQLRLDLDHSRWRRGAKVTVRLECSYATVANPVQTFSWDGSYKVLRFDVTVSNSVPAETLILRFDLAIEGLRIAALRPEIRMKRDQQYGIATSIASFFEALAPKSAFASYTASDRKEVLGRLRSLQISTGIDVFVDCLSIRPGEQWKRKLQEEISSRDIFWLFWSRDAMKSPWVDWEWRTALSEKTINGIQPHPLEPSDLAPAPQELSELQFGGMYEWYITHLRRPTS